MVLAWDEATGDVSLKRVVETYQNESFELVHICVKGEEIIATPGHPFYSPTKGWTDAIQLRAGDMLTLVNGEYVVVEDVQHELLENPICVYNFQVEDYHTYYVANAGVLVHNKCTEDHHILSNKNSKYTPQFEKIVSEYGLDLDDDWNIIELPNHHGRHTSAYHEYVLEQTKNIASNSKTTDQFLAGFQTVVETIKKNPRMPYWKSFACLY